MTNSKNLLTAAERLTGYWSPQVVGQINDQYIKVAKVKGELAWHQHDHEDEMFLILKGQLRIEYKDRPHVDLAEGEFHIVPKGVLHNPVCDEECLIALVEPVATKHTGELIMERTVSVDNQLSGFKKD